MLELLAIILCSFATIGNYIIGRYKWSIVCALFLGMNITSIIL